VDLARLKSDGNTKNKNKHRNSRRTRLVAQRVEAKRIYAALKSKGGLRKEENKAIHPVKVELNFFDA
jgi:hypothetical protein